jgi:tetratricopeptide (TPR) repeat protein
MFLIAVMFMGCQAFPEVSVSHKT